ncbi:MAG: hypothetical protein JW702_04165 [Clostridiales bacterium]|nr:hypothetical protein [Clostridiales bacterium]
MTESNFHKLLKQIVAKELKVQDFTTYEEPLESRYNNLWWTSYRPDVLGTKNIENSFEVVLVECETKPTKKRILEKMTIIQNNLFLQKRLFQNVHFIPLLVIPSFSLAKILSEEVRNFWEIWIVNHLGKIKHKISVKI